MVRWLLVGVAAARLGPLWAAGDANCDAKITRAIGERGGTVKVCVVTERLIAGRQVILTVLNFDEQSERFGNLVRVLDYRAAAAGKREVIFEDSRGIDIQPFLFRGRKTLAAIADFDGSGRVGWALVKVFDTGTALEIECWDRAAGAFQQVGPWGKSEDGWYQQNAFSVDEMLRGMVEVKEGEIRIPAAVPVSYRLVGGRFVKSGSGK